VPEHRRIWLERQGPRVEELDDRDSMVERSQDGGNNLVRRVGSHLGELVETRFEKPMLVFSSASPVSDPSERHRSSGRKSAATPPWSMTTVSITELPAN